MFIEVKGYQRIILNFQINFINNFRWFNFKNLFFLFSSICSDNWILIILLLYIRHVVFIEEFGFILGFGSLCCNFPGGLIFHQTLCFCTKHFLITNDLVSIWWNFCLFFDIHYAAHGGIFALPSPLEE